jgi:MFS family permease
MGRTDIGYIVLILFLLHQAGESMLTLSLDVHLEQEIKDEHTTGRKRGTFLTISNLAWVISPLLVSFLVKDNDFSNVYLLSSIILIPLLTLTLFYFKNGKETNKKHLSIVEIIKSFRKGGDTVRVIGAQFMLQFFFSWMTIYLPLLLSVEIGFEWQQIGLIFTIMLLPFLLFEIPAGALGDKKWGEKELLKAGFLIMSITTFLLTYIDTKIFFVWAILLFITRVGASIVEISSESYFFKHVKEDDTDLISIFRMSRPFSFVFAPLIALPVVYYTSYSTSFAYLAIFTLLGLVFIPKKDTR